jgi:hypothetical protein
MERDQWRVSMEGINGEGSMEGINGEGLMERD